MTTRYWVEELNEVIEITIRSEEDAVRYIEQALAGEINEDDSYVIKFDGWPVFSLDVEGERYHSTLTSPMMKALLEYQQMLNRVYTSSAYSRGARALTEEDRAALELTFKVTEGCSDVAAKLEEVANRLGEKMIDKMTGRELVITVLGITLAFGLYFGGSEYLEHDKATLTERNRHELEMRLIQNSETVAKVMQETNQALVSIIRSTPDATKVTAGNIEFDRDQIVKASMKERESTTPKRIDGEYFIHSIKSTPDKWRIDVSAARSDEVFKVDLYKGHHGADGIGEITSHFISESPIYLHVLARLKDQKVMSASILGTKSTGIQAAERFYASGAQPELDFPLEADE